MGTFKKDLTYSEKINSSNVYLNEGTESEIIFKKNIFSSLKTGDKIGHQEGILSFFISENEDKKKIWPTTCPHEGANLTIKCIKGDNPYL